MSTPRFVIGTRGSELALWQARHIQERLAALFPGEEFPLEIIRTQGDRIQDHALYKIEDKGFFTKEIEAALLSGHIDIAVHSLKDLPTDSPDGLLLGAIPPREDAHDVWIAADGSGPLDLPTGARVGTSSLRRQAQLRALRIDLTFVDLRGNVPSRLRRLGEGTCDAIVLARAGLHRLGLLPEQAMILPFEWMLPAPGQGALGVQVRSTDAATRTRAAALDDPPTRLSVTAERAFLGRLQGGCLVPVGAHAAWIDPAAEPLAPAQGRRLRLRGVVADLPGDPIFRDERDGVVTDEASAVALGCEMADAMTVAGAGPLLQRVREFLRSVAAKREPGA